ncbi:MAG: hypothetical protein D3M94_10070 [Rhodocyclales bacterium GT-UBC]|nr:MAG: hypothetical protein D3M94_10070 [Rhodocyclales bacterium GT-UBC]
MSQVLHHSRWRQTILALALLASTQVAWPASSAPLLAINAYIEKNGDCSADFLAWNRRYSPRAISGESTRTFYYQALSYLDWGRCSRPFFRAIFSELHKVWLIRAKGYVSEEQAEAKEAELINLFFSALDNDQGNDMVRNYEARTAARLSRLEPEKQFFNCTFFGQQAYCAD